MKYITWSEYFHSKEFYTLLNEFKEKVKKDYKATTDSPKWDEAYNSALEETFGTHNLTSDAEREKGENQ